MPCKPILCALAVTLSISWAYARVRIPSNPVGVETLSLGMPGGFCGGYGRHNVNDGSYITFGLDRAGVHAQRPPWKFLKQWTVLAACGVPLGLSWRVGMRWGTNISNDNVAPFVGVAYRINLGSEISLVMAAGLMYEGWNTKRARFPGGVNAFNIFPIAHIQFDWKF